MSLELKRLLCDKKQLNSKPVENKNQIEDTQPSGKKLEAFRIIANSTRKKRFTAVKGSKNSRRTSQT